MTATMTFSEWQRMEFISAKLIPVVIVIAAILLLALAIVGTAIHPGKIKNRLLLGMTAGVVVAAGLWGAGYLYIKPYLKLNELVTARVRTAHAELFGLVAESSNDVSTMAGYNDYPDLDRLPMYDRHTVTKQVSFKGTADNTEYFTMFDRLYSYMGKIKYTTGSHAYLEGYRYTLNDDRYRKLGFIDPTKISTVALVIPETQKKQIMHLSNGAKVYYLQTSGFQWTTETVSSLAGKTD